jgi:hypothetical protein
VGSLDKIRTKQEHNPQTMPLPSATGRTAMSEPVHIFPNDPYERACDQAIAMCNGSTRGAIKALIMANEYLETELQELQASVSKGFTRARPSEAGESAEPVPRNRLDWYD